MTLGELWGRFQADRFPASATDQQPEPADDDPIDEDALSPTTIETYRFNFKLYILPDWKDVLLEDVRPFKVQAWLRTLKGAKGKPLAPATKAKLRNQMSALFQHAILNDLYTEPNPIKPVKQSAKRLRKPVALSVAQMRALLDHLTEPIHRVAIFIAAATALRRSEIRGLMWNDIDFDAQWIHLRRGVIRKMRSRLKTEASRAGIPLQPELAQVLLEWRKQTPHPTESHFVLASSAKEGKEPIWLETVLARYVRPAAVSAGIKETIGWHTFRRSLGSLMVTMKEHPKVAQELLRHANARITMELYQQADHDSKRNAQKHTSGLFVVDGKKAS
jgi:integrase